MNWVTLAPVAFIGGLIGGLAGSAITRLISDRDATVNNYTVNATNTEDFQQLLKDNPSLLGGKFTRGA
jgi:gas vesicle protein